tara:strand:+ start:157 stop:480 length:324 start_codon:yes stop_codon:yes gene_type:complete
MTRVFDGMARTLVRTFGGAVSITPVGGTARDIQAIFREIPFAFETENGRELRDIKPVLAARASDVADLRRGALVAPGNGKTYRYLSSQKLGSPSADGLTEIALELVE